MKDNTFLLTFQKYRRIFHFWLMLFSLAALPEVVKAQNYCCQDVQCQDGTYPTWVCDEYPDTYGPFYVKVYLYFVVPPNAPNAFTDPLAARSAEIWSKWREAYSPHRIYFVSGFGECDDSEKFNTIISNLTPTMDNVDTLRSLNYKHDNGVDVYIFRDDIPYEGSAFCIPHNYYFLGGTDALFGEVILSKTQIVSHELGHCLGLSHTFEKGGGAYTCTDDGTDCEHKGDFVCDTPPDNGIYNANGTCTPSPMPPMDFTNIMSGFKPQTCLTHFTPGQGQRMRRYLQQSIGDLGQVRIQDIVITGQVTWTTPMNPGANIIIEPGGQLTIDAMVAMQENARIYVRAGDQNANKPGGLLIIKRTVTSACDKLWGGVVVEGRDSWEQNSPYQGKVFMYGAGVIEHAQCGILVNGLDGANGSPLPYATGGIVSALYPSIFRNNVVDVQFGKYQKEHVESYFSGVRFTTTDDYRGVVPPVHLKLNGVYGLEIKGGSFKDERTAPFNNPATRAIGIDAHDAGGLVHKGVTNFEGLFEGIRYSTVSDVEGNSAIGATFDACFTGIYCNDNNNFVISGNTFTLNRPGNYTGADVELRGVYMDGGKTAFVVSDNTFFFDAFASVADSPIGTDALSIGTMNQSISDNHYENLTVGNRASGQNATTSSGGLIFSGLMYECNTYESNGSHDNWVRDGSIRLEQGQRNAQTNAPISTGNRYNEILITPVASQFTNKGTQIFYHHIENTSQELLDGFFIDTATIKRIQSDPNDGCDDVECPPPCDTEAELATIKTQFFQEKQTWTTKTAAFPTITDQVQRQNEANAINRLRLSLDVAGSRILLHYALDTLELKKDSILTWLGHLGTYNADLRLARHHFFVGNYTEADNLLQIIPSRYNLSGDLLAEFNDIAAVLQAVRPSLQAGIPLDALSETLVNTLETTWGADCSAVGALARNILYRNGLRREANCEGSGQKANETTQNKVISASNQSLRVYPNPASNEVLIDLPENTSCSSIAFVNLSDGRVCLDFTPPNGDLSKINIGGFSSGIYAVLARMADGSTLRAKLLIAN